jgi:hypothetical protein
MANKKIRTNAPDTVAGVQRRAAAIDLKSKAAHSKFDDLVLDTLVGIAEAGKKGSREPDDPIEVAREVLRFGAKLYDDPDAWITWENR